MSLFELAHPEAVLPERMTSGAVGYDLHAVSHEWNEAKTQLTYDTGIKLGQLPEGHFVALYPRSSVVKTDLRLANGVGVIDPDYTGTIKVVFDCPLAGAMILSPGNARLFPEGAAIAQLVIQPYYSVPTIDVTAERGDEGFGSTNKKGKK